MKNILELTPGRSKRFAAGKVILRADEGSSPVVGGHAAVYDQWTTLWEGRSYTVRERIVRGAFDRALRERQDVRALFNHDPSLLLGRTSSGTCRLALDDSGLCYEVDLPDTVCGRDTRTLIERGDVTGSSFAFTVAAKGERIVEEEGEEGRTIVSRELLDLDLYDVSPVTYPAYDGTDVSSRAEGDVRAILESIESRRSGMFRLRAARLRMAGISIQGGCL